MFCYTTYYWTKSMSYDVGIIASLAVGVSLGCLNLEIRNRGMSIIVPVAESSVLWYLAYGHFCVCYGKWCRTQKITMRIHHKAGERLYVDFAGKRVEGINPSTGEVTKAQIFVATMGALIIPMWKSCPIKRCATGLRPMFDA